jgi:site-specific recombinase XerC
VWLARQSLAPRTRQEYRRWVRLFCAWLGDGADERALGADPLVDLAARDYAARDFKRFLKSERALGAASVNLGLAAVDHFYRHLGVGRANVRRESLPQSAPRALSGEDQRLLLRAAERAGERDRALVVLMVFAGLRIGETVALDVEDVAIATRKGVVVVRSGKGDAYREVAQRTCPGGPHGMARAASQARGTGERAGVIRQSQGDASVAAGGGCCGPAGGVRCGSQPVSACVA